MNKDKKLRLNENNPEWKGYNMDELRYELAYTQARLEIEKERMVASAKSIYSSTAITTKSGGIVGRILGSLNYVDYAIIAFRLIKKVRGVLVRR